MLLPQSLAHAGHLAVFIGSGLDTVARAVAFEAQIRLSVPLLLKGLIAVHRRVGRARLPLRSLMLTYFPLRRLSG
jgi:hypothetical protein